MCLCLWLLTLTSVSDSSVLALAKAMFFSLCVVLSLCVCVWCFRRWQSSTFYQTTATFALGGRPLYVESMHRFSAFHLLPCMRCRTSLQCLSASLSVFLLWSAAHALVLLMQLVSFWCVIVIVSVCVTEVFWFNAGVFSFLHICFVLRFSELFFLYFLDNIFKIRN